MFNTRMRCVLIIYIYVYTILYVRKRCIIIKRKCAWRMARGRKTYICFNIECRAQVETNEKKKHQKTVVILEITICKWHVEQIHRAGRKFFRFCSLAGTAAVPFSSIQIKTKRIQI